MASGPVTPVATIDATGLHLPSYEDGRTYLQNRYRGIYGQDVNLDNATQDGQFLSILALALQDCSAGIAAAYNAFSPLTAQGAGLSRVVKINGIRRKTPSRSTVDVRIIGQAGATLIGGVVGDGTNTWTLPTVVTIPIEGELTVQAIAVAFGAVEAPPDTITSFVTFQQGFQSVTNPSAATAGQPIETDPQLKARQALSTAIPAQSVLEGLAGAIAALSGVTRFRLYENDTNVPDPNGQPGHTVAAIIEGGDPTAIAQIIATKKGSGGTYGSVLVRVVDRAGIAHDIRFGRPRIVNVSYRMGIKPLRGYSAVTEAKIRENLVAWTKSLGIGNGLPLSRAYDPVNEAGTNFQIVKNSLIAARDGQPFGEAADIAVAFDEALTVTPDDVTLTYVS